MSEIHVFLTYSAVVWQPLIIAMLLEVVIARVSDNSKFLFASGLVVGTALSGPLLMMWFMPREINHPQSSALFLFTTFANISILLIYSWIMKQHSGGGPPRGKESIPEGDISPSSTAYAMGGFLFSPKTKSRPGLSRYNTLNAAHLTHWCFSPSAQT